MLYDKGTKRGGYMNFGEKLKRARLDAKVTQSELAERLNTTSNTISNWENNVSKPDLDKLAFICGILHVNASYFLQAQLPEDEVSITELTMIKKYRDLDPFGQETVSYILNREFMRAEQLRQNKNASQKPEQSKSKSIFTEEDRQAFREARDRLVNRTDELKKTV